jgi:hypothetical protein
LLAFLLALFPVLPALSASSAALRLLERSKARYRQKSPSSGVPGGHKGRPYGVTGPRDMPPP